MSTAIKLDTPPTSAEHIKAYTELIKTILEARVDQATMQSAIDATTRIFNVNLNVSNCEFKLAPDKKEK